MRTEEPHKICTPFEYFFIYRPKGKHSVCFEYDGAGNVAIWYLTDNVQKCGYGMECLPGCKEGGKCSREAQEAKKAIFDYENKTGVLEENWNMKNKSEAQEA